jgi:hypothetical protein
LTTNQLTQDIDASAQTIQLVNEQLGVRSSLPD